MLITTTMFFLLLIFSFVLASCNLSIAVVQPTSAPTVILASHTPTIKSPVETRPEPSITPTNTVTVVQPSPTASTNPACIASNSTNPSNGWDCISESSGFTIHFPAKSEILYTKGNLVHISLYKSAPDPRVDRIIEIHTGEDAEACFSPDAQKDQIGENEFTVNNGEEPSGVVYAWRSYAIAKETQKVCFFLAAGYMTFPENGPIIPPEKDQGLEDIETILATFKWLNP